MFSSRERLELLIASLLPTTATLLVGVIGIEQMQGLDIRFFLLVLFVSAAVFGLEYALIVFMQQSTRKQIDKLVLVCRDYLNGDRQRRPDISGDHALSTLARMLHRMLDAVSRDTQSVHSQAQVASNPVLPHQAKKREQIQQLDTQIQNLIREIMPVTQGNLCMRAEIPQGNVGVIADLFNSFIEQTIELVLWIRYSSSHITNATHTLTKGAIGLAQAVERQILNLSQTTRMIETLMADSENISNKLQLNIETLQKMQMDIRQSASSASFEKDELLQHLAAGTKHQEQLLEEALNLAQSNGVQAKSLISDFHAFAKCVYESSVDTLQATEQMKSISVLAQQWYNIVTAFQLPAEIEEQSPLNTPQLKVSEFQ